MDNKQNKKMPISKKPSLKLKIPSRKLLPQLQQPMESDSSNKITQSTDYSINEYTNFQTQDKFYEKYELKQKLGEGASAIVYRCIKKDGSGQYAVKITKCQIQEITTMKKSYNKIKLLDHQSIIKYKSIYIQSSKYKAYLVMELFNYPNLALIKFQDPKQIQHVSYQILQAIAYMHEIGLCHRDIKPQNILYNQAKRQIKIIDFGVSREIRVGRLKKQMMTCTGTLFYKAPQLFKGGFYDQLIDQWAAGVTIYRLIAGVTPFQCEYVRETIENIQKGQVTFKQAVWDKYSSSRVKDLISGLLSPRQKRIDAQSAKDNLWFQGHKNMIQTLICKPISDKKSEELNGFSTIRLNTKASNKVAKKSSKQEFETIIGTQCQSDFYDSQNQK